MNTYTKNKLIQLKKIIEINKNLLLTGGIGVGKTYLAEKLAEKLIIGDEERDILEKEKKNNIIRVSLHPGYTYEDFVRGISVITKDANNGDTKKDNTKKLVYESEDKILLNVIKKANKAEGNIVLILDDINRCDISSVFGDMLNYIDRNNLDGDKKMIVLQRGKSVIIPDNFYIIATMNTAIKTNFKVDYEFFRKFSIYNLKSDYRYIEYNDVEQEYDEDNYMNKTNFIYDSYKEVNTFIEENISDRYKYESDKYLIGHGLFYKKETLKIYDMIKYNIVPILYEYCNEGIINSNKKVNDLYDKYYKDVTIDYNEYIDKKIEINENKNSKNKSSRYEVEKLIEKILKRKLISNSEIFNYILKNRDIINAVGKSDECNINGRHGNLLHEQDDVRNMNYFYKNKSKIKKKGLYDIEDGTYYKIDNHVYRIFSWYTNKDKKPTGNTTPETVQNINDVLYNIVNCLYLRYIDNIKHYNQKNGNELQKLYEYAAKEIQNFRKNTIELDEIPKINGNTCSWIDKMIYEINELKILNMDKVVDTYIDTETGNERIEEISIIGVYRMNDEYGIKLMDDLEVRQMILQGPPGTSKTYTAKKIISEQHNVSKENLNQYKIKDYENKKLFKNKDINDKDVKFVWDIVQFHPSYGYEDFIRGIEVGTPNGSEVTYNTVNKILGNMAKLAKEYSRGNEKGNPEKKFYLIIDEINRANMATVFGELIYALEYRGESVATPYKIEDSNDITIPDNLYIIGTMNTADKSVGGIDYAIRRRFLFISLLPSEKVISDFYIEEKDEILEKKAVNLFNNIKELFRQYKADDYHLDDIQIGHTYFLIKGEEKDKKLKQRFIYQMLPILREYYKDGLFKSTPNSLDNDKNAHLNKLMLLIMNKVEELKADKEIIDIVNEKGSEINQEDIIIEYIFEKLISLNSKVVSKNE